MVDLPKVRGRLLDGQLQGQQLMAREEFPRVGNRFADSEFFSESVWLEQPLEEYFSFPWVTGK